MHAQNTRYTFKKGIKACNTIRRWQRPPPPPDLLSKLQFQLPNDNCQCTALLQHANSNKVAATSLVELHSCKFCSALLPAAAYQNTVTSLHNCHTVKLNAHWTRTRPQNILSTSSRAIHRHNNRHLNGTNTHHAQCSVWREVMKLRHAANLAWFHPYIITAPGHGPEKPARCPQPSRPSPHVRTELQPKRSQAVRGVHIQWSIKLPASVFTQRRNKANTPLSLTAAHWHWMIFAKAPRQYSSHQTGGSHGGDAEGSATLCQWASGSCVSKEYTTFIFKGQRSSRPRKMANDSQLFFLDCLALQTSVRTIFQHTENQSPNHTVSHPRRHKPAAH